MINHNCLVTINKLSGTSSSKQFSVLATNVPATILPTSNETLTMYPDVPIGSAYSLYINSSSLTELPAESEVVVTDAEGGALTVNDKFQVREVSRKEKVFGNTFYTAVLVKI